MTCKEVSETYNIPIRTITGRARNLNLIPIKNSYFFSEDEIFKIVNYKKKGFELPKIVYIHTIWEIRESKLNFIEI